MSHFHKPKRPVASIRSSLIINNFRLDLATLSGGDSKVRPSPSSTTLEDVLDSLLGLPSSGRAPSPCLQETVSASTSPQRRLSDSADGAYRRRSEGSEPASVRLDAALPTPALLRCRYSRCGKTTLATSKEAENFKNCHNCSYTYCSRACRRSHWERHRKTCLFSRMGTLCRQVIASTKEKKDVLKELSVVAKRGYISHGLGAVKCFYPNPEAAERFLSEGLCSLGELTFVRWQDLLPSEMGPQLYEELVNMCKNYNPETKFVLYVSICVVSETPASGAVKWERQLVSRCAKIRLSKDLNFAGPEREVQDTPETLILTCAPIRLPTKETTMRARVIAVDNLQGQLRARGVSLKRQYPEIYKQLDIYCEDISVKVEAQTIYPRNASTNKSFMCIIMLESDSETLRHVEKAGVKVKTIDVLLSSETTAL
ncbi:apical junction component 1 homolog [Rhynchophorus ferrugineus]|uniref:apical junction component 1 homolog n=1 Tax=Rhynchophorus ferrugineus TaxID=354439 RepID=UPI003FCC3992